MRRVNDITKTTNNSNTTNNVAITANTKVNATGNIEAATKPNYIQNQKKVVKEPVIRNADNYTYIPSSENLIKKEQEKIRPENNKYIPSQLGAKINKSFDNSGLEAALKRADRAEKVALQTLAGNFNGI